jgi:hypothetical protein
MPALEYFVGSVIIFSIFFPKVGFMYSKLSHSLVIVAAILIFAACSSTQKLKVADPKNPAQTESGYQFTISRDSAANQGSYQSGNIIYTPKDKNMKIASGVVEIKNVSGSERPRIEQNDVFLVYLPPGATEAKAAQVELEQIRQKGEKDKSIEDIVKTLNTPGTVMPGMKPGEILKYTMKAIHEKGSTVFALFVMPATYIRFVSDPSLSPMIEAALERFKAVQGFISACSILPYPAIEELMKSNSYTMTTCNARGITPLIAAIASGNAPAVEGLLAAGANAREKTHYGLDEVEAIHVAAIQGSPDAIELLAKRGADVLVRSSEGNTPLGYAVEKNKIEAVKRLCSLGADPSLKQVITNQFNPSYTPLEYATKRNLNEIHDYLISIGITK